MPSQSLGQQVWASWVCQREKGELTAPSGGPTPGPNGPNSPNSPEAPAIKQVLHRGKSGVPGDGMLSFCVTFSALSHHGLLEKQRHPAHLDNAPGDRSKLTSTPGVGSEPLVRGASGPGTRPRGPHSTGPGRGSGRTTMCLRQELCI